MNLTSLFRRSLIACVLAGAVVGFVVAALAAPSIQRSVIERNERMAIADILAVISAEMRYKELNRGFFDSLECVAAPVGCVPGFNTAGHTGLDPVLASSSPRAGYERRFYRGSPPPESAVQSGRISPSSIGTFAIVLVPLKPGQTGKRAFCGDSSDSLYYTTDGSPPKVIDGLCGQGGPRIQ